MRIPGLDLFAMAACAVTLAAPGLAQDWQARETPLIPDGAGASPICLITSGDTLPIVAFTFERDQNRFAVQDSQFRDIAGVHPYSGTLPSGATLTLSLGSDASSDLAVLTVDRVRLLQFLEHFFVAGDFSLVGDGVRIAIPALPDAAGELQRLQSCLGLLDNA